MQRLSLAAARRVALAAQGFDRPRPDRPPGRRDLTRVVQRLGQVQIDSINVLARAHYLPLYSRLGPYDVSVFDTLSHRAPRTLFEYWGHAASLIDVNLQPALRWKMARAEQDAWKGVVRVRDEYPALLDHVLRTVAEEGPLSARQIEHEELRRRDHWGWNWSAVKTALEWHFWTGQVTSAWRNSQFERVYDIPRRVLPPAILDEPTPDQPDAHLELARRAARALGVFSERCVADYFRMRIAPTRVAIAALEASGEVRPVEVDGWPGRRWMWHEARVPRRITARSIISPFDSLIFERERAHRLFDLFYRIEIYVPEAQRQYGYYVYPFLLGDSFVARVDLKADRANDVLVVRSAWLEPGQSPPAGRVAEELAGELWQVAGWRGLAAIRVDDRGDLAADLGAAVAAEAHR